jgi:hypothetical protein
MSWLETYTGKKFDPFAPRVEDLCLEDIAHSLARLCRFNGHTVEFYSVAQHAAEMSLQAMEDRLPREVCRWCLLHDAAEAYVTDVPRPIKAGLGWQLQGDACGEEPYFLSFAAVELVVMRAIAEKFSLPWPMPPVVAEYDLRMLVTEKRDLLRGGGLAWDCPLPEPFARKILPAAPYAAEGLFINVFRELENR